MLSNPLNSIACINCLTEKQIEKLTIIIIEFLFLARVGVNDKEAAATGTEETTMTPTAYVFPKNPRVALWDLPGFGSLQIKDPKDLIRKYDVLKFDAFIFITSGRFQYIDAWMLNKIKSIGKPFLFVRTKIDEDIRNEEVKKDFNAENLPAGIRKYCLVSSKGAVRNEKDIFLINSHNFNDWDFPRLVTAIHDLLPPAKSVSFLYTVRPLDVATLNKKVEMLKGEVSYSLI